MQTQHSESADTFAGWDPRKEHYMGYQSSTVDNEGPMGNYSRSANLARNKENVSEPYGLYVRNVPLNMKPESLQHMFSEHGKVLSVYVRRHKPEQSNYKTTWAILKVENMRDVLAMISALSDKPPLHLKVELSLTEEERNKRRKEKDMDSQFQQEVENMTASRMDSSFSQNHSSINFLEKPKDDQVKGMGRGKFLAAMNEIALIGNANREINNNPSKENVPIERHESPLPKSDSYKTLGKAVVEIGCGSGAVGYRKPRPCVACGALGQLRCSICKAWYCGKLCQVDDWFYHMDKCSPPPPLEDADSITSYISKSSHKSPNKSNNYVAVPDSHEGTNKSINCAAIPDKTKETESPVVASSFQTPLLSSSGEECTLGMGNRKNITPNMRGFLDRSDSNGTETPKRESQAGNPVMSEEKQEKWMCPRKTNNQGQKLPYGKLRRPFHAGAESGTEEAGKTPGKIEKEANQNNNVIQPSSISNIHNVVKEDEMNVQAHEIKKPSISTEDSPKTPNTLPKESSGILTLDQPSLVDKMEIGAEYRAAVISAQNNYTQFSLTIMLESSEAVMDQFMDVLPSLPQDPTFKPSPGSLVGALSKQDGTWYRAYVHAVKESKYSVCYIDFFDMEEVEEVRALPSGPLRDYPGLSMIGKLHAMAKPEYQKELECLILPDSQVTLKVMAKKANSCKVGIKSEKTEILAHYILRSWYTGIPNYNQITSVEMGNPNTKIGLSSQRPMGAEKQAISAVCQFVPHSVLVTQSGKKDVDSSPSSGNAENQQKLDHPPVNHSIPKIICMNTSNENKEGCGELKSGPPSESRARGVLNVIQKSPGCATKKFWAQELKYQNIKANQEYTILPIWVSDDNMLYVQIITESTVDAFSKILADITTHCQKEKAPDDVAIGELVCGLVPSDEMWYRCEVLAVDEKQVTVHLCDFGNQEQIIRDNLRCFSDALMREHRFCIKVKLEGVSKKDMVAKKRLNALVESQEQLIMKAHGKEPLEFILCNNSGKIIIAEEQVNKKESNPALVSGRVSPRDVTSPRQQSTLEKLPSPEEKPIKVQLASDMQLDIIEPAEKNEVAPPKAKVSDVTAKPKMYEDCKSTSLPVSDNVSVVVLEASTPHAISVVPVESLELFDKLETLSVTINKYCNSRVGLHRPKVGEMCLAKFSEDNQWYRAACVSSDIESSTVFFVDYGNFENTPHTQLCQILDSFLELPCIALHCILKGISVEGMKEEAFTRLQILMPKNTPLVIKVVQHNEEDSTYIIDVPEVTNTLIAEGLVCKE